MVVNAHGALIAVGVSVARGQKLVLTHHSTGEEQQCQVVHIGQEYHGKTEVAVEFLHPAPHFWHISFPPRDWKQVKT